MTGDQAREGNMPASLSGQQFPSSTCQTASNELIIQFEMLEASFWFRMQLLLFQQHLLYHAWLKGEWAQMGDRAIAVAIVFVAFVDVGLSAEMLWLTERFFDLDTDSRFPAASASILAAAALFLHRL